MLYRNRHDGTYEDVSLHAGLKANLFGQGVAVADYDDDGFEDIFISGFEKCGRYHINEVGTFTDVTATGGIAAMHWRSSAVPRAE